MVRGQQEVPASAYSHACSASAWQRPAHDQAAGRKQSMEAPRLDY